MLINKAIITAAGLGTRLLSATKEMPKEMLPLFSVNSNGELTVKPVLQLIFEQLYDKGFRKFCFIVGRGKRSVEDHFTSDYAFIELLSKKNKTEKARELKDFYRKIESSTVIWINQPEPKGFGDAVLRAEAFAGNEPVLVHAGDTYIISKDNLFLDRMLEVFSKNKPAALLLLKEIHVRRQLKHYGVAEAVDRGDFLIINRVVEKPEKPPSNLAIMPIYIFNPVIFEALREINPSIGGELQLTDAIQKLIERGLNVQAIKLHEDELRLDVGTPETYWEALKYSYKYSIKLIREET